MKKIKLFTLVELLAAMAVFSLLMLALMTFFNSAQKLWVKTAQKTEQYENARLALDLIARDLECLMYNNDISTKGIYPFWFERSTKDPTAWAADGSASRINFISATPVRSSDTTSKICEVKYAKTYKEGTTYSIKDKDTIGTDLEGGWLVRSCTGDNLVGTYSSNALARTDNNFKYNFQFFPREDTGDGSYTVAQKNLRAFYVFKQIDGSNESSDKFRYVIPYVIELKFTCIGANDAKIVPVETASLTAQVSDLPATIKIELTLLDKESWNKWIALGGNMDDPDSDSTPAKAFRENTQRKFSKIVFLNSKQSE